MVVISSATELCIGVEIVGEVRHFTLLSTPVLITHILSTILLLTEAPLRSGWGSGLAILVLVTNKACSRVAEAATIDLDNS